MPFPACRALVLPVVLTACTLTACSGSEQASPAPIVTQGAELAPAEDYLLGALIGVGCEEYQEQNPDGKASFEELATVSTDQAIANLPGLGQFSAALSGKWNPQVDLTPTLERQPLTVLAPTDAAFQALGAQRIAELKGSRAELDALLTHHVLGGELLPGSLVDGTPTTSGQKLSVRGGGNQLTVDGAKISCGGIRTANGVLYVIDKVLDPS